MMRGVTALWPMLLYCRGRGGTVEGGWCHCTGVVSLYGGVVSLYRGWCHCREVHHCRELPLYSETQMFPSSLEMESRTARRTIMNA